MGQFYGASQRGEMHLGAVERYSVFNFARTGESLAQSLGSLRVLNQYHLLPGAKLDQQWFDPFGLGVLVIQGCYTHQTCAGKAINVVAGQGLMLWTDGEIELEVVNPSPYEELVFLQLWFDVPSDSAIRESGEQVFPLYSDTRNTWQTIPLFQSSAAQSKFDIQLRMQQVATGHTFKQSLDDQTTAWLYLVDGHLHVNDQPLSDGDSFTLSQGENFQVDGSQGALLLLIEHRSST